MPDELPLYVLPQRLSRAVLPKIGILIILSLIFYSGILLNITLLELTAPTETMVKLIALIFLLGIIFLGILLAFRRAKLPYTFYQNKITFNKEEITLNNILNTTPKSDLLDKIFKTYSINLGNNFHLRHIPEQIQIKEHVTALVGYAKSKGYYR